MARWTNAPVYCVSAAFRICFAKVAGRFDPATDTIKVLTIYARREQKCPVVALVDAGHMPAPGEEGLEEAKLFYVGATRATQRLIIGASARGRFAACIPDPANL